METALDAARIKELFHALDRVLHEEGVVGELYVVGGAVLCLALSARSSTRNVDAYFEPATAVRRAALRVARDQGAPEGWLNDAVKGFLSPQGAYRPFLELPNLRVLLAQPEYLLAMKCLAFRLGPEFQDEADVRFLLRCLNIERHEDAVSVITRYYPRERFPQKTFFALEEMLGGRVPRPGASPAAPLLRKLRERAARR